MSNNFVPIIFFLVALALSLLTIHDGILEIKEQQTESTRLLKKALDENDKALEDVMKQMDELRKVADGISTTSSTPQTPSSNQ